MMLCQALFARIALTGAFLSLAFSATAFANDLTASLDTGELVLIPNVDIRLLDEDLFISPDKVRVRYSFENTSTAPITATVAFPVPPVDLSQDVGYSISPADPVDFVGFKLSIDGKPTPFKIDARATVDGRDVTDILEEYDIPLTLFTPDMESFDRLRERLDSLPVDVFERLRAEKIIHGADWGEGFYAAWTANVSYFWTMTFPPGRALKVEHSYTPVPTSTFYTQYRCQRTRVPRQCLHRRGVRASRRRAPQRGGRRRSRCNGAHLHPDHGKQLAQLDRAFPPHDRQALSRHARFAVSGRNSQDRSDNVRMGRARLPPGAGSDASLRQAAARRITRMDQPAAAAWFLLLRIWWMRFSTTG